MRKAYASLPFSWGPPFTATPVPLALPLTNTNIPHGQRPSPTALPLTASHRALQALSHKANDSLRTPFLRTSNRPPLSAHPRNLQIQTLSTLRTPDYSSLPTSRNDPLLIHTSADIQIIKLLSYFVHFVVSSHCPEPCPLSLSITFRNFSTIQQLKG